MTTYNRVVDPLLNSDKPARSTDVKQLRDNQDHFDGQITSLVTASGISDQSISDDFMGTLDASGIRNENWSELSGGAGGQLRLRSEHQLQMQNGGLTSVFFKSLSGTGTKQRIVKTEEYVAIMEVRIMLVTGSHDHHFYGWNDVARRTAADGTQVDDVTDCVGIVWDSGGDWKAITANGGSTTTVGPFGTAANWEIIRLEFTCSATAGSRKVEVYLADSLQGTMATDGNIPSVTLGPVLGVRGEGSSPLIEDRVDYAIFTVSGRPLAA